MEELQSHQDPSKLEIKRDNPRDIENIRELAKSFLMGIQEDVDAQSVGELIETFNENSQKGELITLIIDGKRIGILSMKNLGFNDEIESQLFMIGNLTLLPEYRGKGLFDQFIAQITKNIRNQYGRAAFLASTENTSVLRLSSGMKRFILEQEDLDSLRLPREIRLDLYGQMKAGLTVFIIEV
jgi:N-acetylglutamate synthase-like GNAT family acetyltransferase